MSSATRQKTSDTIRYRLVKSAPVASIVALYKSADWWQESPAYRATIPAMIKKSFAFAVAETARGKIVGMGRVISDGVSDGYIQDIVVLKPWRGRGIGQGLTGFLAAHCVKKKLLWVGLVAEPGTYGFYRKLGFQDKKGFQLMLFDKGSAAARAAVRKAGAA
jgi:ribosomal protein S18 acetylase RimI-like enzyme